MIEFEKVSRIKLEEDEMLILYLAEIRMAQVEEFSEAIRGTPLEGRCIFLGTDVQLSVVKVVPANWPAGMEIRAVPADPE